MKDPRIDQIMFATNDLDSGLPAMTTMLYRVCDQDSKKFEEACRLMELFIAKALETK